MSPTEFMDQFAHLPDNEIHTLRDSEELDHLPQDHDFYLKLAQEVFPGWLGQVMERQRFVWVLCEIAYANGLSFLALMYIAEYATEFPDEFGGDGISATAGLSGFFYDEDIESEEMESYREYSVVLHRIIDAASQERRLTPFGKRCLAGIINNARQCLKRMET